MIASRLVADEEVQRHIRWQVLLGEHCGAEMWANLPVAVTPSLEWVNAETASGPIRLSAHPQFEHTVFPTPTQTNVETRVVRQMQRVVLLRIG